MSLGVSIIISLIFATIQFCFFFITKWKMKSLNSVFPNSNLYDFQEDENGNKTVVCNSFKNSHLDFILNEINTYLRRNRGAVDFPIIEHKVERHYQSLYEDAISKVSFPTYIGLMGTFLGVGLGLLLFNYTGGKITDAKISNLINGVIISMTTSLVGLLLTTLGNYYADKYRANIDANKNIFYEFIQNELLPTFGTSTVDALNKLDRTVNKFEPAFNRVISNFQTTFDRCTDAFGTEFRQNVEVISSAVTEMGKNMQLINKNVDLQQKLLNSMQSKEMNQTLARFISAISEINRLSNYISDLEALAERLQNSTSELTRVQAEYNKSLKLPQQVAEKLTSILNRFATFEESINKFGEELRETETFGTVQMQLVRDLLYDVKQKSELAMSFQELEKEKMNDLYKEQLEEIDILNKRYVLAIQSHADTFSDLINEFNRQIEAKNTIFLNKLEEAFDVSRTQSQFEQLNKLPDIDNKIATIEEKIASIEVLFKADSPLIKELKDIKKGFTEKIPYTSSANKKNENEYPVNPGSRARPYIPSPNSSTSKPTPLKPEEQEKEKGFIEKLKFWKK